MLINLLVLFSALVLVGILLNKKAMGKFKTALSAMLGKGANKIIEADPVAVYKERIDNAAEELKKALLLLEDHSALIKGLKRKIDSDQNEYIALENYIKKLIDENDPEKTEKANQYANTMVKLEETIATNKNRLDSSEQMYTAQSAIIKKLKETVLDYREKSGRLASDLQTSKAEAKISELTEKFDSKSLGFDNLQEVEDIIQMQIDKNESKSKVAKDLHTVNPKDEIIKEQRDAKAKELIEKISKRT